MKAGNKARHGGRHHGHLGSLDRARSWTEDRMCEAYRNRCRLPSCRITRKKNGQADDKQQAPRQRSALQDVVTREYTINVHKRTHDLSFKKSQSCLFWLGWLYLDDVGDVLRARMGIVGRGKRSKE